MSIRQGIRFGIRQGMRFGINVGYGAVVVQTPATATILTEGNSSTDGTSVATAAFTPIANRVVYAAVGAFSAVSLVDPTATGNGLTWVQVAKIATDINRQLTVFRAQGATPSNGVLTFDHGVVLQTSWCWAVIQYAGADATGTNGSGATGQSATQVTASGTSVSVTLGSPLASSASKMLVFTQSASTVTTADVDFVRLLERSISTNTHRLAADHATNQTNCVTTLTGAQALSSVAIEVKAA